MKMRFEKCRQLIGSAALEKLKNAKVAVFGVGGVGGFVAEALARSGVGGLCLVDKDVVDETNVNRQIVALTDTVGMYKTDVMKERIMRINPDAAVEIYREFYLPENAGFTDITKYDYVVDAMDNVTAKTELICRCKAAGTPVISAMGAGNRLDPTKLKTADIFRTDTCPLARIMRKQLSCRGVTGVKTVYSTEIPIKTEAGRAPASMMPVPAAMGLIIAAEVIRDLMGK